MRQIIKRSLWVLLLASGLQTSRAYSLAGPVGNGGDAWQGAVIGYGPPTSFVAPKNIGEEYRRNLPVMYYSFTANFLDFFGSNGVAAVQSSFAILNGLTNVDSYKPDLSEFPLETRHLNYQAQALGLLDLKSWTLGIMMEQLGLGNPVEWAWTLHDRFHVDPGAPCPANMEYLVVQRNFDPVGSPVAGSQTVLSLYSPYINDILYSYYISEACIGANPLALTVPFAVDPLADSYSSVATFDSLYGVFYTGLTRDDVAGLRYLLSANNINFENSPAGSILLTSSSGGGVNYGPPVLLFTSNYNAFAMAALTNNPVTLSNLFPGLVIVNSSYYSTNIATPIVVAYFTNLIGAPYGSPPMLVVRTNGFTYSFPAIYSDTFANLVIIPNGYHPNTSASLVTVTVGVQIGAPYGSPLVTNTSTKSITLTNVPSGEYYINTNYLCAPPLFLSTLGTNVTATTNLLFTASNSAGYVTSQSLVTYATNHVYVVQWPICSTGVAGGATNGPGLREGIEKMRFVEALYDSYLGQFFQPITNTFTSVLVTNSQAVNQTLQRVVTRPDFIFSAADLEPGPAAAPAFFTYSRNLNFDTSQVLDNNGVAGGTATPTLAGPGLITPSTTITFDKVGPVFYNEFNTSLMDGTPYFTETPGIDGIDLFYQYYFVWASFDGTTNDPVVYPDGGSIQNLENQILVQIAPTSLPNGTKGAAYPSETFTATGGAFTYSPAPTWSATGLPAAPSSGLPPGLTLSSGGTLSGTPTQSGTFDFYLVMTDALGRSVQWFYFITIQ
jgi:hypothetical protein